MSYSISQSDFLTCDCL